MRGAHRVYVRFHFLRIISTVSNNTYERVLVIDAERKGEKCFI